MSSKLLKESEVEELYGFNLYSLRKWRCVGGGPPFVKIGSSVRYRQQDIESFIEARIRTSTSDHGNLKA